MAKKKTGKIEKKIFEMEYAVKASPKILYSFLTTPSGLSEWFADDVNIKNDIYTFIWDDNFEKAKLINKKENSMARFQWEEGSNEDHYFEFKIQVDDLTGDVALIISDFAEEKEINSAQRLWNTQISKLLHCLGS